jgi:hypothetical protein
VKRFFRILWLKASGDWFKIVVPSTNDEGYGIHHPWRIHYPGMTDTYEGAKKRADTYNEYLIKGNSFERK